MRVQCSVPTEAVARRDFEQSRNQSATAARIDDVRLVRKEGGKSGVWTPQ